MSSVTSAEVKTFVVNWISQDLERKGHDATKVSFADDCDLFSEGLIDSMGLIEMISAVEEKFSVSIDFESMDVNELTILGAFCNYVEKHCS